MNPQPEVLDELRRLVLANWDPLRLAADPERTHTYDPFLPDLVACVAAGGDVVTRLGSKLHEIEEVLGTTTSQERRQGVAHLLAAVPVHGPLALVKPARPAHEAAAQVHTRPSRIDPALHRPRPSVFGKLLSGIGLLLVAALAFIGLNESGLLNLRASTDQFDARDTFSMVGASELPGRTLRLNFDGEFQDRPAETIVGGDPTLNLTARLLVFRLEGQPWMPVVKRGTCRYEGKLKAPGTTVSGEFAGSIDYDVRGICSMDALQDDLRDQIARQVKAHVLERWQ